MKKQLLMFGSVLVFVVMSAMLTPSAYATNGMNLEGYGPIATGMGGASMAYDNGAAAMMNNPATLGLMPEGNRLDVALGYLGPHVSATAPGQPDAKSSADAFFMPALGWVKKSGQFSYGAGMFSQGGMGTEYAATSFMANGSGDKVRSELGVGRILFPLAYEVNDRLSVGGSLDYVWASLDLKMALNSSQFGDMVGPAFGGKQQFGSVNGSMVNTLLGAFGGGALTSLQWARFDFSDDSAFTGKAKGQGFGGKLGAVYKVSDTVALGASYHAKTLIDDLSATGATVSMNVSGPVLPGGTATIPVTGTIKIKDFQWPQMLGAGAAYHPTDKVMIVFDYKWINWKQVMKDFTMEFTADTNQSNPMAAGFGLGGQVMNATLFQNWKDQNVFMLGVGYKVTNDFTMRVGANLANNPIPDAYLNQLFPAIVKNHYMIGAGYMFTKASSTDVSFTYAPEVKQVAGSGVTSTHNQTNAQVMYSYRY